MSNAEYIWKWLWERIGNEYGVAGLMGNMCAESGLNPMNLQNSYERLLGMNDKEYVEAVDSGKYSEDAFIHDQAGFGLCQWTHKDRKSDLINFAKRFGRSIGDLDMQLQFMWGEISKYSKVINTLFGATSVREASDAVMVNYERPADLSEDNKASRADLGQMYYERYAVGMMPKNEKAEKIVQLAIEHLGCKYVFGAKGEIKNGEQVFDCRGFTWWLLQQVGINISPVGATTQYNTASDWVERGLSADMPNLVCPVFKYRKSDGKMAHTGMHIGDGVIIHCTTNGGVKYGDMADTTWTNYAIPKGLYTAEEIENARGKELVRTLKVGCSGNDVKRLQEVLNSLGYDCGEADGIFGSKTKAAVIAFQKAHGLTADGVVGMKTRDALENVTGEHGGEESDEEKNDTTNNDESHVLPKYVTIPLDKALEFWRVLSDSMGMTVDSRSGNVSDIDFM